MKLIGYASSVLLCLSSGVLARPQLTRSRGLEHRRWAPFQGTVENVDAESNITYNTHWAGAVKNSSDIDEVAATIVIPHVWLPKNAPIDSEYGLSWWVGVDGVECGALLQVGFDLVLSVGFDPSYQAWVEWYPEYTQYIDPPSITPGDNVRLTARAESDTSGIATFENLSTGQNASVTFDKSNTYGKLCRKTAEWIVEDFSLGGAFIPIINFTNSTFTEASYVAAGKRYGVEGSDIWYMQPEGESVKVACSLEGTSEVFCKHT